MLRIARPIFEVMINHVQADYPLEACGLLAGQEGCARHLYAVENLLQSPTAFEMEPLQQVKAMMEIEALGETLLAIYHSHPHGPSTPSATDVAYAYYEEAIHLIISLQERMQPIVRAFTIVNGQVAEILIMVE